MGNISKSGSLSFQPTYSTATNRITSLPGASVSYDANGNMTNDGTNGYAWDADNRPTGVGPVSVTYDALGRAVEQLNSGNTSQLVYGPLGGKLAIMNGQSLVKGYTSIPGGATTVYNSGGLAYYRHPDWLGSSRLASTPTRTIYSGTAYAPFGEPYNETGTRDRSFTGKDEDTASGLYDFPARTYCPVQGRWLSPDPAGHKAADLSNPQSLNRYGYVNNSPLSYTDPSGLDCYYLGDTKVWYDGWHPVEAYWCPFGATFGEGSGGENVDAGRGGSGGGLPRDSQRLPAAFNLAMQALGNSDCAAVFGHDTLDGRNLTARAALISIDSGGAYGKIEFGPVDKGWALTTGGWQQWVPGVNSPSVTITIDNSRPNEGWNNISDKENAALLLHELGHATYLLGFRDQQFINYDWTQARQDADTKLIDEKCMSKIK